MALKTNFIDRLIERLDLLDPQSVQGYIVKLVREKGLLDTIFKIIHEGVLIIDRDLKIHFLNEAAISMLGLPSDIRERDNQSIKRYLKDLDWGHIMSQNREEWGRATRQEIEIFYPNHRYLQFYLFPYDNEFENKSNEGLATIILQDVTEFRKKAKSTIETEKIKTMTILAAGVAHEIGNPLNSLAIHLQLLERHFNQQQNKSENEEPLTILNIASQEVKRLDSIINRFLKAIRPVNPELKSLVLKELISETLKLMSKEIEDRGIFVECSWAKDIPSIMGDEIQLQQAFYNIINNSIQAMSRGGILKILLQEKSDSVLVSFADNGRGISPDELGNIFNPYYTTKKDGSGLGLMIVERIVNDHGGELRVESDIESGTIVSIKFMRWDRKIKLLERSPVVVSEQESP